MPTEKRANLLTERGTTSVLMLASLGLRSGPRRGFESIAVASEGDHVGRGGEPVDHGCGDDFVAAEDGTTRRRPDRRQSRTTCSEACGQRFHDWPSTPRICLYVHYWLSASPSSLKRRSRVYSNSVLEPRLRTASPSQPEVAVSGCQSLVGQCNCDAEKCSDKDE
jgi:hypothetical protein